MKDNILFHLRILKSNSRDFQIQKIQELSDKLIDLSPDVYMIIRKRLSGEVLKVSCKGNESQIVQLALLSIAIGDLASIPMYEKRRQYLHQFFEVASTFGITENDIILVAPCYQDFERLFEGVEAFE